MTTALYRRYRPETFGEMIGQSQVTEPLMTALRGDRVGHAYLFSGPRGCGKTTSARILARCLNCAQGPTDTPCGQCDSCVELSRGGGGSLDVVEIDAASHNGVDDARDLRERAIFAPARDRFKIFILDEAHMVTAQGFNALLKLVEEPPAHVKFIFATTEPEKVIGTIRSRTHHYPFRLVAPAAMLEYVEQLCGAEGVQVETGVLPLVVRAGGGSPRDTLSLLDQLIAGSDDSAEGTVVRYERAVALLGYTHGALLDEVVDAFAGGDAGAAFGAVDRVVQTGQDPRRFVDDLLERLRDLIIVAATGEGATAVLRGVPADELERMGRQAAAFGTDRLSRIADLVVTTLDEMNGATSPRLQLELLVARVLAGGAAVAVAATAQPLAQAPAQAPVVERAQPPVVERAQRDETPAPPAPPTPTGPVTLEQVRAAWPEILKQLEPISRSSWMLATGARAVAYSDDDVLTLAFGTQSDVAAFKKLAAGKGPSEDLRGAIRSVLGVRVKYVARHEPSDAASTREPGGTAAPSDDVPPDPDPAPYEPSDSDPYDPGPSEPAPERPASGPAGGAPARPAAPQRGPAPTAQPTSQRESAPAQTAPVTEWAVAAIPADEPGASAQFAVDDEPEEAATVPVRTLTAPRDGDVITGPAAVADHRPDDDGDEEEDEIPPVDGDAPLPPTAPVAVERAVSTPSGRTARPGGIERVGEAVVRQVLDARFVREEPHTPPTRFN
ncbi:DNA polymerase III subunit gamma and tau [Microbacterium sp. bgisy189]|uniref:DNA polymerase III subunit gamma and tau n=1 Tax=Microbacterium sp. bgisy189 TaxID=3413798 RepID=UPI003EBA6ABA